MTSIALAGYLASSPLAGLQVSIGGLAFDTLSTIYGIVGVLVVLGAVVAMLKLHGSALSSEGAADSAPDDGASQGAE